MSQEKKLTQPLPKICIFTPEPDNWPKTANPLPGDSSFLLTLEASPVAAPGVVSTGMRGSPRYCGVEGDQPPADVSDDVTMECDAGVRRGDEVTMEMGGCS